MMSWPEILDVALREGWWQFARSSGPGGQNVNKVETKVIWKWNIQQSSLPDSIKNLVLQKFQPQLSQEGELTVASSRHRTREMNRSDCLQKITELFEKKFFEAPPRKRTKPTRSSKEKRLAGKRRRSLLKSARRSRSDE